MQAGSQHFTESSVRDVCYRSYESQKGEVGVQDAEQRQPPQQPSFQQRSAENKIYTEYLKQRINNAGTEISPHKRKIVYTLSP